MAHFTVRRRAPVAARVAWERVLDLHAQEQVIPFTTVRRSPAAAADATSPSSADAAIGGSGPGGRAAATDGELRVGTRFVGRTACGPVGFDDPMVVEALRRPTDELPGFARIRKEGTAIRGWIYLTVTAEGPASSQVVWSQVISVRGVPRALDPLVAAVARAAYGWAVGRLLERE
jgi:hypothetical protein